MSSQRLHVDVVSAEEQIFSGEAEFAVFPGVQGEIGVYPRHTPLLTHLKSGTIHLKLPDRKTPELVYVSGGILEIQPELVTVLADTAIRAHDLDEAKAIAARQNAEALAETRQTNVNYAAAEAELMQSVARLKDISKLTGKRRSGYS